ncbi:hypothetical protein BOTBODRAFT_70011 [Botryobasidium botryosum FD-172 SS1]|uniref:F-box domain-containing protein n=1 Tax=Botryobasidium botryosum (strain FD-172 SS1) TaxID=930990 RepID=A0A067LXC3_BOTB1|nr:hypothetical protein BOTBODRAFT_70011 [Botryobasidium botryosum FD-172 SS1]
METIMSNLTAQLIQVLSPQIFGDHVIKLADRPYKLDDTDKIDELCSMVEFDLQAAKSALDSVINSVATHTMRALCDVRIHRNRLRPSFRLPNELIANIFELVEKTPENSTQMLPARAPMNVSQVSTLWREIALNDPNLWTSISVLNAPLHRAFLPRSKGAPLDITLVPLQGRRFGHPYHHTEAVHDKIMSMFPYSIGPFIRHLDRWRTLEIDGLQPGTFDYGGAFASPAPRLETLHVNVKWHENNHSAVESAISRGSSHLFGGQTPRLRDLTLGGLCIPLTSPIYHDLNKLSLANINFDHSSINDFIAILAACPLLKMLSLRGVEFPMFNGDGIPPFGLTIPIHMLRLESIDFCWMDGDSVRRILTAVRVPASAKLHLVASNDTDLRGLLPPTAGILDSFPFLANIRRLHVYTTAVGCEMFDYGHSLSRLHVRIIDFDRADATLVERVVSSIGRELPLPGLEALTLERTGGLPLGVAAFSRMLHGLRSITFLKLVDSTTLVEALILTPTSHMCPLLEMLHLHRSEITREDLLPLVTSRIGGDQSSGHFRSIKLTECKLVGGAGVVRELEGCGLSVEWDGCMVE